MQEMIKAKRDGGLDPDAVVLFGGLSRDEFVQARVHRKIHALTEHLSDESLGHQNTTGPVIVQSYMSASRFLKVKS